MILAVASQLGPPPRHHHAGDQFYNQMLPYFPDLLHEPELSDLQALLLLMLYLIGIYKMGHLWHLSRLISAIAFELGLHRSDANWSNFNPLEREMRKRVFFITMGLDLKVSKCVYPSLLSNLQLPGQTACIQTPRL
jgi:Fungal specific transcription factor domain